MSAAFKVLEDAIGFPVGVPSVPYVPVCSYISIHIVPVGLLFFLMYIFAESSLLPSPSKDWPRSDTTTLAAVL